MKKIAGLIAVFLICSGVFAIDVNKGELESAQKERVLILHAVHRADLQVFLDRVPAGVV